MSGELRIEDFLSRSVEDSAGRRVGRLHEVRVERDGEDYIVVQYLIGVAGLLERLGLEVWRGHAGGASRGYVARWDQLDLSDPFHPRLTCPASELERWPEKKAEG